MKERMAASAHTAKNGYLLQGNPILHPNMQHCLSGGTLPKTKKNPNHIFRIALSRYGGNAKIAIASGHQFGKWRFAGDARIVSEKEQSDSARKNTPVPFWNRGVTMLFSGGKLTKVSFIQMLVYPSSTGSNRQKSE